MTNTNTQTVTDTNAADTNAAALATILSAKSADDTKQASADAVNATGHTVTQKDSDTAAPDSVILRGVSAVSLSGTNAASLKLATNAAEEKAAQNVLKKSTPIPHTTASRAFLAAYAAKGLEEAVLAGKAQGVEYADKLHAFIVINDDGSMKIGTRIKVTCRDLDGKRTAHYCEVSTQVTGDRTKGYSRGAERIPLKISELDFLSSFTSADAFQLEKQYESALKRGVLPHAMSVRLQVYAAYRSSKSIEAAKAAATVDSAAPTAPRVRVNPDSAQS